MLVPAVAYPQRTRIRQVPGVAFAGTVTVPVTVDPAANVAEDA